MQYTVAVKNFFGFWKNHEVTSHSFDGRLLSLELLGGDILNLPYSNKPFKLKNLPRQLPPAREDAQQARDTIMELENLRQQIRYEREKIEELKTPKPSLDQQRNAIIEQSAQARVSEMLGREVEYGEARGGRVLQGGVHSERSAGFN